MMNLRQETMIRRYIDEITSLELAGECANALQAFAWLQHQSADLLFLDIRMPQLNGNDFLKTLKNPPEGDLYHCLYRICPGRL